MTHPFRFGVELKGPLPGLAWAQTAQRLEELGYSNLVVPDHFDDQFAVGPALAAAAAATNTLRLGAQVYCNDYRHPVMLAKEVATLDVLSNGRMDPGAGRGLEARRLRRGRDGLRPTRRAHRAHGRVPADHPQPVRGRASQLRGRALHHPRPRGPTQAGAVAHSDADRRWRSPHAEPRGPPRRHRGRKSQPALRRVRSRNHQRRASRPLRRQARMGARGGWRPLQSVGAQRAGCLGPDHGRRAGHNRGDRGDRRDVRAAS